MLLPSYFYGKHIDKNHINGHKCFCLINQSTFMCTTYLTLHTHTHTFLPHTRSRQGMGNKTHGHGCQRWRDSALKPSFLITFLQNSTMFKSWKPIPKIKASSETVSKGWLHTFSVQYLVPRYISMIALAGLHEVFQSTYLPTQSRKYESLFSITIS